MACMFIRRLWERKRVLFLALCGIFCAVSFGRYLWIVIGPDSWGPQFMCAESIYDFGEIPKNQSVYHEYIINNTGRKLLHILKVTPGCGACLKADIYPKVIAPGDNAVLKVVLDLSNLTKGKVAKKLLVKTDDPNFPEVIFYVTGTVTEGDKNK
jgi:hypothetical protein